MRRNLTLFGGLLGMALLPFLSLADDYKAKKAAQAPAIDGNENDACWATVPWSPINHVWDPEGAAPGSAADYTGHYKAVWNEGKVFILMRVTDDKLVNWYPNEPLKNYWMSDCPEIFIDEDRSKGNHQCNYNAFAYHISLTFNVVDSDKSCNPKLFNDALTGARTKVGDTYYWEFALNVFTDAYVLGAANNPKAALFEGKVMGFSIAYNDSDDQPQRERMYGSQLISPRDPQHGTNVSYINADYFGTMELVAGDGPTAVEESVMMTDLWSMYPNPASHKVEIKAAPDKTIHSVRITNAEGVVLLNDVALKGPIHTMDISPLPSDLYFVEINSNEGVQRKKLMIRR